MDDFIFASFIVLGIAMVTRLIIDKANRLLSPEKKAELVDLFSGSKWKYLFLFLILLSFFLSIRYRFMSLPTIQAVYFPILVIYALISSFIAYRKLSLAHFPANYIQRFILSQVLRMVAVVYMIITVLFL